MAIWYFKTPELKQIIPFMGLNLLFAALGKHFKVYAEKELRFKALAVIAIGYAWYNHFKPKQADDCGCDIEKPKWFDAHFEEEHGSGTGMGKGKGTGMGKGKGKGMGKGKGKGKNQKVWV